MSLGSFLLPEGYDGPRGLRALARESSALVEVARLAHHRATTTSVRRGTPYALRAAERHTHPVVLVPGFLAGDYTLRALARHLRDQGHRTYRSGILLNAGCTQDTGTALESRVEQVVAKRGQKVVLVGHSLGGMLSRGLAARRPDLVAGLVTMGSPVLAPGAVHTALALHVGIVQRLQATGLVRLMAADCTQGTCAQTSWEQTTAPLPRGLPYTSVYSRRDGIVDWRACLDPAADHVPVRTSHCGMAIDPVVFAVVDEHLARVEARARRQRIRLAAVPRASAG